MIYFVRCGDWIKIGMAQNVIERVQSIQAHNPYPVKLLAVCKGYRAKEGALHRRFKNERRRGEWFVLSERLTAFIRRQISANDYLNGLGKRAPLSMPLDAAFCGRKR